jgi:hypothetical protein
MNRKIARLLLAPSLTILFLTPTGSRVDAQTMNPVWVRAALLTDNWCTQKVVVNDSGDLAAGKVANLRFSARQDTLGPV